MIDRVTFHVRDGIAVTGVGKIYDPAKRKTRTMAGAVIRLSEYEDTGLEPCEIVKLKEERDAAVRDIEGMLHMNKTFSLCRFCKRWPGCITFGCETCRPLWRGLKVNIFLNGKFTCRMPYMARNNFGVDGGTAITRIVHKYEETQ